MASTHPDSYADLDFRMHPNISVYDNTGLLPVFAKGSPEERQHEFYPKSTWSRLLQRTLHFGSRSFTSFRACASHFRYGPKPDISLHRTNVGAVPFFDHTDHRRSCGRCGVELGKQLNTVGTRGAVLRLWVEGHRIAIEIHPADWDFQWL